MTNGRIDLNGEEILDLVGKAKSGDAAALSQLVVILSPVVRAQAKKVFISNGLEPDDLFQEGMFGVLYAIKNYDASRGASFLTYVNLCIRSKLLSAAGNGDGGFSLTADGEFEYINIDGSQLVYCELTDYINSKLTEKELAVLKLFLSGYSYQQIAEKLSLTVKAVDGTLQRVRKKLRGYFN